jgi:phage-related protein
MRTVNFFRTESGNCPVEEFLDSLSGKQVRKVIWVLRLIEELEVVPGQYLKKLVNTDDIWEIRVQFGGDIFRLLGFFDGSKLLILTNSLAKKTQKMPRQEIELATRRKNEYMAAKR